MIAELSRQLLEKRLEALAHKYRATHLKDILDQILCVAGELASDTDRPAPKTTPTTRDDIEARLDELACEFIHGRDDRVRAEMLALQRKLDGLKGK